MFGKGTEKMQDLACPETRAINRAMNTGVNCSSVDADSVIECVEDYRHHRVARATSEGKVKTLCLRRPGKMCRTSDSRRHLRLVEKLNLENCLRSEELTDRSLFQANTFCDRMLITI